MTGTSYYSESVERCSGLTETVPERGAVALCIFLFLFSPSTVFHAVLFLFFNLTFSTGVFPMADKHDLSAHIFENPTCMSPDGT